MLKITTKREAELNKYICYLIFLICSTSRAESIDQKISNLPISTQNWLEQSCPKYLGPSLWKNCMEREISALNQGMPDAKTMSSDEKEWIEQSCPSYLGPSLYKSCMEREKIALKQGMPSLSSLSPSNKKWILDSCPRYLGPSLFRSCVLREMNSLK